MSDNTLKNQNNPFTATELLEFANLQIAVEALYGLLDKASVDTISEVNKFADF